MTLKEILKEKNTSFTSSNLCAVFIELRKENIIEIEVNNEEMAIIVNFIGFSFLPLEKAMQTLINGKIDKFLGVNLIIK